MLALQSLQQLFRQRLRVFCSTAVETEKGAIYDVHSTSQLTGGVTNELVQQANKTWIRTDAGLSFVQPGGERRGWWVASTRERGGRGSLQQKREPEDAE